jgi:hypothetical protein
MNHPFFTSNFACPIGYDKFCFFVLFLLAFFYGEICDAFDAFFASQLNDMLFD